MRRSMGHYVFALPLVAIATILTASPARAFAADTADAPSAQSLTLSTGAGRMVRLPRPMADLFVAESKIADVQVRSPTQLYVFGKAAGETTVYATDRQGAVIWSTTVRVGTNISSVGAMLRLAMPDADITATPMNGLILLTGKVATPSDIEEAQRLTQAFVGEGTQVISRIKAPTPLQVNLQVRIAEVSRDFVKSVGVNLASRDTTGGFSFGISQGRGGITPNSITNSGSGTTLGVAGKLLGMDILAALDLGETDGFVTTLAQPNLTAISGETASFLAGGEIPIPVSQGLGNISIEYKQYGVSLAFTPTVLGDGRIAMRVRPEVSQLTATGSVTLEGFTIPGITTRRTETTVELGSGQAMMIGGLLSNSHNNSFDKAPGLANLPILGALFRSNSFRRSETELVIVVTPYLVMPVDANAIALPTDGYRAPSDADRLLRGKSFSGQTGGQRPKPALATPATPPVSTAK
jgi:pilus assembly protein CpaC